MSISNLLYAGFAQIHALPPWVVLPCKATLLLAVAWLLHFALAWSNPRWRVFLWRATATGLVVLSLWSFGLPGFKIHVAVPAAVASTPAPPSSPVAARPELILTRHKEVSTVLPAAVELAAAGQQAAATMPSETVQTSIFQTLLFSRWSILWGTWGVGAVLLIVRLAIGYLRLVRLLKTSQPAPDEIIAVAQRIATDLGCRQAVQIRSSTQFTVPFLYGLRRAVVVLPKPMCEPAHRLQLPGILTHELAHVRSGDFGWNVLMQLLSILLWFHPLAWRIGVAHRAVCDVVCDAVSASYLGDVRAYCRTLALVALDALVSTPTAGLTMARVCDIRHRIAMLDQRVFGASLGRRGVAGFTVLGLLACVLLAGIRFALAEPPPPAPIAVAEKAEAEPAEKLEQPAKIADTAPETSLMRVRVLDPQGKPLPDAKVHASIWTEEKGLKANRDYTTDAEGAAQVELPRTYYIVRLWASKKPFVTLFSHWEQNELNSGTKLPEEYTIQLEQAVTAGGRIVDEDGNPIVGAKVQVMTRGGKPAKGDSRTGYNAWLATKGGEAKLGEGTPVTTDTEGCWRIDNVPDNAQAELILQVSHPDYVSDESWDQLQKDAGITTEILRKGTATLTLERAGIIVQGRMTDADGEPIKDAIVVQGDDPYFASTPKQFLTDADGRFRLPAMRPRETSLTVIAPGFAPQLRRVNLQVGLPPQDFRLAAGKPIQLRFVDATGAPIPEVYVQIRGWRGVKSLGNVKHPQVLDTKIPERADKNGVWDWTWAPDDPVKLYIYSYPLKGYAPCELEIAGGAPPRTVVLKAEHRITGSVTDAATGKPIQAFTIIPVNVFRKDWLSAERTNAKLGKDGRLDYLAERTDIPLRLRIEAMGYHTQTGPEFRVGDDTPRTQDFPLQPSEPVTGVVLDAAGEPVAKAEVFLATPTEEVQFGQENDDWWNSHRVITDATGRFTFPDPGEPCTVLAHADAGFAMADFPADQRDVGTLRLQPWASIRGRFCEGGKPIKNAGILINLVRLDSLDRPRVDTVHLQLITDDDGRFAFPRVPPVPIRVRVSLGPWRDEGFRSGPSVPLDLRPGQEVDLKLGQAGATIQGKVTLTGNVPADLDCSYSLNYLVCRSPGIAPPPTITGAGFDIRKGWQSTWLKTQEGRTYLNTLQHWFVKLAPDGSFRISGVPVGKYDLALEIYAKPSGCLVDPLARKVVRVTVTAEDVSRGELTLPDIPVTVVPVPVVGDTPSLSFQRPDGSTGSLADFRGHNTVVHFWASWCGPCKQQLPALRQVQKRFAAGGLLLLGLSLDEDAAVWQSTLEQLDLPWQQGRLAAPGETTISGVPAYWLLDPAGKIVAKANDPDELPALRNADSELQTGQPVPQAETPRAEKREPKAEQGKP